MKNETIYAYILAVVLMTANAWGHAGEVSVAVAANFAGTMKDIAADFTKKTGHKVSWTPGATGRFYAQITNGAPFDILLSADDEMPAKLEQEGKTVTGSRFTYAIGRLVLWSPKQNFVDEGGNVIKGDNFNYLAIANAKVAPYGRAAVQTMQKLGVLNKLEPKIVQGENIAQTHQFVATGNAQLGFVALSQVQENGKIKSGSAWVVPESLHDQLRQDAVLLNSGKNNPVAEEFLKYLKTDTAKNIIAGYGYSNINKSN